MSADEKQGVCDVCRLLDGDRSIKAVRYCGGCDANLCAACARNPIRRARAALKRGLGGDEEYERKRHG